MEYQYVSKICERAYLWAHTRCTRTQTLAHTLAPTHARPHARTQTLRIHAVPRELRVSASTCVCARVSARKCANVV
jgi:hypothetical protein